MWKSDRKYFNNIKPVRSSDILKMLLDAANLLFGPDKPMVEQESGETNKLVDIAKEYVLEHYYEKICLTDVADKIGVTPSYLSTLFQRQLEKGFIDFLNEIRIERACTYLQQNYFKTYEIAYKVGFNDEKYFSKVFKKIMGCSPAAYRKIKQ